MRAPGVEPGALAWEAKMLPLHHARDEITEFLALREQGGNDKYTKQNVK